MDKTELLQLLHQQNIQWEAFLETISKEQMVRPGVNGEWSMKDMVAHLTAWNVWLVSRMQAANHQEPEPSPPWPAQLKTEPDINAWIYTSNRGRLLNEVLQESQQTLQALFDVIESMPEQVRIEKVEPMYYLIWIGNMRFEASEFFDHYHDDHEPDVRAWLARQGNPHTN